MLKHYDWRKSRINHLSFDTLIVRREAQKYHKDCYVCMISISVFGSMTKCHFVSPILPSAIRPVSHTNDFARIEFLSFVEESGDKNKMVYGTLEDENSKGQ